MPRYLILGTFDNSGWSDELPGERHVDALTPTHAVRKAGRTLVHVESVQQVPDDAGRGPLWRLLRLLKLV